MRGIILTKQSVEEHQRKHGFSLGAPQVVVEDKPLPKPRMNKTETEFSLMLEAQKRRGEILEWRFEGISLAWGCDPVTGKPMWFTPDFYVVQSPIRGMPPITPIILMETKGPFLRQKDLIRFKGCRSDWPMFFFELHQKTKGGWAKIL